MARLWRTPALMALLLLTACSGGNPSSEPDTGNPNPEPEAYSYEIAGLPDAVQVNDVLDLSVVRKPDNQTVPARWVSTNPTVADLNAGGDLLGLTSGKATVVAYFDEGMVQAELNVADTERDLSAEITGIEIVSLADSLPVDQVAELRAMATDATGRRALVTALWATSNPVIATTVSGQLRPLNEGNVSVNAQYGAFSTSHNLQITAAPEEAPTLESLILLTSGPEHEVGHRESLIALGTYSDGTTAPVPDVQIQSENTDVAYIDADGQLVASSPGTTDIIATRDDLTANSQITITGEISGAPVPVLTGLRVWPQSGPLLAGQVFQLNADVQYDDGQWVPGSNLHWTSDQPEAVQHGYGNTFRISQAGDFRLTASHEDQSASVQVIIDPITVVRSLISLELQGPTTLTVGDFAGLTLQGTYSDSNVETLSGATYRSSNTGSVSVSDTGILTANGAGTATLTAEHSGLFARHNLTVLEAVTKPPVLQELFIELSDARFLPSQQRTAVVMGRYSDGNTREVTGIQWISGDETVLTVNNSGQITAVAPGVTSLVALLDDLAVEASVTVSEPAITGLMVQLDDNPVAAGLQAQAGVQVQFESGIIRPHAAVSYQSSNPSVFTVDQTGRVTGQSPGEAVLTVSLEGQIATASITVAPAALISITASADRTVLAVGEMTSIRATGHYTDGTSQALASPEWSSSNPAVITTYTFGTAAAMAQGSANVTAIVGAISSDPIPFTVGSAAITGVSITADQASIAAGTTGTFALTGHYTNGDDLTLTGGIWAVDDGAIATVTSPGSIRGVAPGTAIISVDYNGNLASLPIVIDPAALTSLELRGAAATSPAGIQSSHSVIGIYSDSTEVDLTDEVTVTADPADLTVARGPGTVSFTGLVPGSYPVTLEHDGISLNLSYSVGQPVTTGVQITDLSGNAQAPFSLEQGLTQAVALKRLLSDGSDEQVTADSWSSASPAYLTIDGAGVITAVAEGQSTITGQYDGQTATLVVDAVFIKRLERIEVAGGDRLQVLGDSLTLSANEHYNDGDVTVATGITWSSSDPAVATVDPSGTVNVVGLGSTTILADNGTFTDVILVTASNNAVLSLDLGSALTLPAGNSTQASAIISFENAFVRSTDPIVWRSTDPAIATVDVNGNVTAVAEGTTRVEAETEGVIGSVDVTVTSAVLTSLAFSVDNTALPHIATFNASAEGTLSDGSTSDYSGSVTWHSTNPAVLAPAGAGKYDSLTPGIVEIWANSGAISSNRILITVSAPVPTGITASAPAPDLRQGATGVLTASLNLSDGSTTTPGTTIWSSDDPAVFSIDNSGAYTAVAEGSATVTVTDVDTGLSDGIVVTVGPARLLSIALSADIPVPYAGQPVQLTATPTWEFGQIIPISDYAWASTDPAIASVDASGRVTTLAAGTVSITAQSQGVVGNMDLTVSGPIVTAVTPDQASLSITDGDSGNIGFVVDYSDGSQAINTGGNWSSDNPSVISVTAGGAWSATAAGSTQLRLTVGGHGDTLVPVTVAAATVTNITLSGNTTVTAGDTLTITATGHYSNGDTGVLAGVQWASEDESIATVDANGTVTAVAPGNTNISAYHSGILRLHNVTVEAAGPAGFSLYVVDPFAANVTELPSGIMGQLFAEQEDVDGNVMDVTNDVIWHVSDTSAVSTFDLNTGFLHGNKETVIDVWAEDMHTGVLSDRLSFTFTPKVIVYVEFNGYMDIEGPLGATGTVPGILQYSDASWGDFADVANDGVWTYDDDRDLVITGDQFTGLRKGYTSAYWEPTISYYGDTHEAFFYIGDPELESGRIDGFAGSGEPGDTVALQAIEVWTDGSETVATGNSWSSNDIAVATVDAGGALTLVAAGATQVHFDHPEIGTLSLEVEVTGVAEQEPTILVDRWNNPSGNDVVWFGGRSYLTLSLPSGIPSDGVTWSSSDPAIAGFTKNGSAVAEIDGLSHGIVTITALHQGETYTHDLEVVDFPPAGTGYPTIESYFVGDHHTIKLNENGAGKEPYKIAKGTKAKVRMKLIWPNGIVKINPWSNLVQFTGDPESLDYLFVALGLGIWGWEDFSQDPISGDYEMTSVTTNACCTLDYTYRPFVENGSINRWEWYPSDIAPVDVGFNIIEFNQGDTVTFDHGGTVFSTQLTTSPTPRGTYGLQLEVNPTSNAGVEAGRFVHSIDPADTFAAANELKVDYLDSPRSVAVDYDVDVTSDPAAASNIALLKHSNGTQLVLQFHLFETNSKGVTRAAYSWAASSSLNDGSFNPNYIFPSGLVMVCDDDGEFWMENCIVSETLEDLELEFSITNTEPQKWSRNIIFIPGDGSAGSTLRKPTVKDRGVLGFEVTAEQLKGIDPSALVFPVKNNAPHPGYPLGFKAVLDNPSATQGLARPQWRIRFNEGTSEINVVGEVTYE
ncbi:Ig-like domain-containing protein [Ferrimonas marina]|uniref:Ig-like domain (Group 2) n=1 Tax=Ferrimonas marina TaxID=299255 RepID=A0A1M5UKF3_9GAMM|nr:Ig-like domain-containing protein [Ferrimonas marina]SHH63336.1 Ig-like domain (group 2) [Ferrimonas marina]